MEYDPSLNVSVASRSPAKASYDIERRTALARGMKDARRRAGLSAKEAAAKLCTLGLECTRGTLLAWERGGSRTSREPFASDLPVVATVYQCRVTDFFHGPSDQEEFVSVGHALTSGTSLTPSVTA